MAEELLGLEFDIHGGGVDLVFPHHENEAAQTLAGRGRPLARTWMHNGMVQLGGGGGDGGAAEKMSKSLGNIRGLAEVLDEVGPEALVLYFSAGHYRQPLAFSRERLDAAARASARIRDAGRRLVPGDSPEDLSVHRDAFFDALAEDFNTAKALAALYEWIGEANKRDGVGEAHLREMLEVLGLESLLAEEPGPPPEAVELAERRAAARAAKDWAEADRLRDELGAMGWEVRDGTQGPELFRGS
jgi:cysteinyl-tRNA synthetase